MWSRDSGDEPVLRGQNNYISWSQGRAEMVPGSPFFEWQLPWWGGRDPGSWSMMKQGGLMSAPSPLGPPPGPILLSFIHSLIYSLPTQFTHSPSHLFIHWFIHSLILLPIQFTHSPIHIHSPTHSFVCSFAHSLIPSVIHSFIHLFTHSFFPS